jgi:ABC-type dipeptide/oligopeptide/nickel transport system ATPase component
MPPGCAFAPRCSSSDRRCEDKPPRLRAIGERRRIACVLETGALHPPLLEAAAE